MDNSTLKERAASILNFANSLSNELTNLGLSEPSFEHGLPSALHKDAPNSPAGAARQSLLQELDEFRALLTEPTLLLTPELASCLRAFLPYDPTLTTDSPTAQPEPQRSSVQELAHKLGLGKDLLRRLLAHAATHHIYRQASPDFYVHTAASRVLAEDEGMRNWVLIGSEELIPATLKGWNLQNNTDLPIFRALANMPARAAVFAGAMSYHAQLPGFSAAYLVSAFPWTSFDPSEQITIVDVGGGLGHVSKALIAHSPRVRCIVQDSPGVVAQAQGKELPPELQGRLSFQGHDFFDPQPVQDADMYLLRLVLHDWSDKYAVMIIRALTPALKPGARVVVNERVLPALGEAHYLVEREGRDYDMYMLAFQNAKERTAADWKTLFKAADERFGVGEVAQPEKSALAVVVATWGA
ncbi:MAG: hypothetical protein Q9208_006491 [Pyrenodesmia sp. 3 TL-2023]